MKIKFVKTDRKYRDSEMDVTTMNQLTMGLRIAAGSVGYVKKTHELYSVFIAASSFMPALILMPTKNNLTQSR